MKTPLASLALLVLLGCGSNDPGTAAPSAGSPVGSWLYAVDAGDAVLYTFAANTWKSQELIALTNGKAGIEINSGTYVASGASLKLTLAASSCSGVIPLPNVVKSATFAQQGDALTLTVGTSMVIFARVSGAPSGMAAATVGCLEDSGAFAAHAVASVP